MQSSNASGSDAPAALRQCRVWVWDENPLQRQALLDALSKVPCVSAQANSSSGDFTSGSPGGIVLSLSDGTTSPSDLKLIATLKDKFAFVVCVRWGEPDLAASCRMLLAGATHVTSARTDDFLSQLRRQVELAAERVLAAQAEEAILLSIMSAAGFAGRSAATFSLFRTLPDISSLTDLPVLITGETGTGKELIASAIHSLDSKRSQRPFVSLNCAALPEQLAESELFGHQRGAFTGAERERVGLFRSAEGGVLFLDEVGELSGSLQSKLLRVLQTGRLRSVGADREVEINVRVIAATNRRLDEMTQDGSFRQDLYHRLNVLCLHIKPLRERPVDIEPLIQHFVEKHDALWRTKGRPVLGLEFLQALQKSSLPGNARQLENLVRRALVDWEGNGPLSLRELPPEIWRELSAEAAPSAFKQDQGAVPETASRPGLEGHAVEYLQQHGWNLLHAIRYLESVLVRGALTVSGGNQSEAARLLGITPRSVYNKLHKFCQS